MMISELLKSVKPGVFYNAANTIQNIGVNHRAYTSGPKLIVYAGTHKGMNAFNDGFWRDVFGNVGGILGRIGLDIHGQIIHDLLPYQLFNDIRLAAVLCPLLPNTQRI